MEDLFDPFADDGAVAPSKPPPRLAKFQPKIRGKAAVPKPEPLVVPPDVKPPVSAVVPKQEVGDEVPDGKAQELPDSLGGPKTGVKVDDGALEGGSCPMDVDDVKEGEDEVVREIDVFLNPSIGDNTQMYVMQYPLRPVWRPYELDGRCQMVRVKPKQMEVELDIEINIDSENYDDEVEEHMKMQVQTLSSSKVPLVTSYSVGILKGNELHLNPVHAAVQLRPSMTYLMPDKNQRGKNIAQIEGTSGSIDKENKEDLSTPSNNKGKLDQATKSGDRNEIEDWLSIEFHSFTSLFSSRCRQNMVSEETNHIRFSMSQNDYLSNLCPGTTADKNRSKGPSRGLLLSMPSEERFEKWFSQEAQVHRFAALMHLAPLESAEDILKLLPQYAELVQGLWISKSSLKYEGFEAVVRDYILLQFSRSNAITDKKLEIVEKRLNRQAFLRIMSPLARKRPSFKDWKLKEPADLSFIKCYPYVVKEQEDYWSICEKRIMDALSGPLKSMNALKDRKRPGQTNQATISGTVGQGINRGKLPNDGVRPGIISDEAREALPKAIHKVLTDHRVCGMNIICQKLQNMAISEELLHKRGRTTTTTAAISFTPSEELHHIISQVAIRIHDVYVLKSLGNELLDPFRKVVIDLLRGSPRNTKLKKAQIHAAAQKVLNRDISNLEYTQVLNELCINSGGGWVLKSGDMLG